MTLLLAVIGLGLGFAISWWTAHRIRQKAQEEASRILQLAEKEAALEKKQLLAEGEMALNQQRNEFQQQSREQELEIEKRATALHESEARMETLRSGLEARESKLKSDESAAEQLKESIEFLAGEYREKLKALTQMGLDDAVEQLKQEALRECEDEIRELRRERLNRSEQEVEREAKKTIITAMQRMTSAPDGSISASTVALPSDEMKGRIIGKEGRNIKAFEALTGVTLMIDELPGSVLISCFDPVRREAAKVALEILVKDGRIHPSSIEEAVSQGQKEIENLVFQYGERAVEQLKLTGIPAEVLSLLGKLEYRYSFNQNTLDHSIETAFLCSMLASELGLDPAIAKRAGLLHDIGKAVDHEYEGSHALMGAKILRRYGENEQVINAVEAHHQEVEATSLYAPLLMVADSISATRPGARVESLDAYVKRLERLETIARDIEGVQEVFAIQAGREIRVMVEPSEVQEKDARRIARSIRNRIEDELQYPSTITVTVIREQRFTEIAT